MATLVFQGICQNKNTETLGNLTVQLYLFQTSFTSVVSHRGAVLPAERSVNARKTELCEQLRFYFDKNEVFPIELQSHYF